MASAPPPFSVSTLPATVASDVEKREGMPTIQFTNAKALFDAARQVQGDFLIVQNVPPADFEDLCFRERRPFRIRRYHANQRLLIVAISTRLHEALHLTLYREYHIKLFKSGDIWRDWAEIGRTTFRSPGHPDSDCGEGDSSGGPMSECGSGNSWPTLVIEAGDSAPLSALQDDMRWWFSASNHNVKIVLLTKFDHQNRTLIIERWEEELQDRQGFQPVLQQSIAITREAATDSYHVTGGDLVLSFRLLFLRSPGPQEGDYVISIADLQAYAQAIWLSV
ncbi:hypothetical protein F4777DRAFT_597417 [Nemania sp. FL0916]|nr:hypothetical protein F4777DRAFT_597417 [Nemania sp. FL0916]